MLDKALEMNPNYEEAMAYKNLLLRDKAAVTKDPAEAKRLIDEADVWFNKALGQPEERTLKRRARKQPANSSLPYSMKALRLKLEWPSVIPQLPMLTGPPRLFD